MDALSMLLENVHLYETRFYCVQGKGNWSFSLTRKDTILFYLVMEGGFCIDVKGAHRKTKAGDIIMIPNSTEHVAYALPHHGEKPQPIDVSSALGEQKSNKIEINQDLEGCINADLVLIECRYDKEVTKPLLTALPSVLPEHDGPPESEDSLLNMVIKILGKESCDELMGKTAMINHLASIIMIACLRSHIESLPEATSSWLTAIKDPYLAKALAVMHKAPEKNWTINKLAEVAGMSRSSFAERFRKIVGMPPLTYLIDYRLRLAARYLRLQQNSISRISELVGYASDSTFSQAFKRVYGMSPRYYRQQFQQSDTES